MTCHLLFRHAETETTVMVCQCSHLVTSFGDVPVSFVGDQRDRVRWLPGLIVCAISELRYTPHSRALDCGRHRSGGSKVLFAFSFVIHQVGLKH